MLGKHENIVTRDRAGVQSVRDLVRASNEPDSTRTSRVLRVVEIAVVVDGCRNNRTHNRCRRSCGSLLGERIHRGEANGADCGNGIRKRIGVLWCICHRKNKPTDNLAVLECFRKSDGHVVPF